MGDVGVDAGVVNATSCRTCRNDADLDAVNDLKGFARRSECPTDAQLDTNHRAAGVAVAAEEKNQQISMTRTSPQLIRKSSPSESTLII